MKSFDFSTLFTTIPHDKLKNRLASDILNSISFSKMVTEDTNIWGGGGGEGGGGGHEDAYFVNRKGRDLTQSYDKSPYTHRKIEKAK